MSDTKTLTEAAQAVLDRWDSPQWAWTKHGPTADLMHDLRAALAAQARAEPVAERLFEAIAHGDEAHRAWLHDALLAFFAGKPVPPAAPQPAQEPALTLPDGWVPLTIEYEPGYPEDVAFGPQRMMDRLKKWLDRYFATRSAQAQAEPLTPNERRELVAAIVARLERACGTGTMPPSIIASEFGEQA